METLNKLSMAVLLQMNNPDLHFAALVRMGLSHHHTCGVRHWLQPSSTP